MRKIGLFLVLFLTFSLFQGSLTETVPSAVTVAEYVDTQDTFEVSSAAAAQPAITNVIRNPSMEKYTEYNEPEGWYISDSGYEGVNISAHAGFVHGGTNSCIMFAQGSNYSNTQSQLIRPVGYEEKLDDGLTISFYFYLKSIPDLANGARIYLLIMTADGGGNRIDLNYHLSSTSVGSSTSTEANYDTRGTTGVWNSFTRNVKADFEANGALPSLTSTRIIDYIGFWIYSPQYATGLTEFVIDDAVFTDLDYDTEDGGFEIGYDTNYWHWTAGEFPTYIGPSLDSTDGTYSFNVNCERNSWIQLYHTNEYTQSYYADSPGDLILEFDWNADHSEGFDGSENIYLKISASDGTNNYYLTYYLGGKNLQMTNTSISRYGKSKSFNLKGQWVHERLDLYTVFSAFGLTGDYGIHRFMFVASAPDNDIAFVDFLLDDVSLCSYPLADPGFEEDYIDTSGSNPITSWNDGDGDDDTISLTGYEHTGTYALNITEEGGGRSEVYRNITMPVNPMLEIDFWWYLENIQSNHSTYSCISLLFEEDYWLNYLVANISFTPTNTSTSAWINVDNYNTTGSWFEISRNLTDDLNSVFSPVIWNLTSVEIITNSSSGNITVFFDDMHFFDSSLPIIDSITKNPSAPKYYDAVNVTVVAHDDIGRIVVELNYSLDDGATWSQADVVRRPGEFFGTIPQGTYGSVVNISVIVSDSNGNQVIQYVTYLPDDDLDPEITPLEDTDIEAFNPEASIIWEFVEHSPDEYQLQLDSVEIDTGNYTGTSIEIVLGYLEIGTYTCTLTLTDGAGNSAEDVVELTAVDTTAPDLNSPVDIQYLVGFTGSTIQWTVSEPDPESYEISRNGVVLISGAWDGSNISINVDGLDPGVYEYILTVQDGSGNIATDTVVVTVTGDTFSDLMTYLPIIGGAAVVVIVIVILMKRKK